MGIEEAQGFIDSAIEIMMVPNGVRALERKDRDASLYIKAICISSRVLDSLGITGAKLGIDPTTETILDACFASQMHKRYIRDPARQPSDQDKTVYNMFCSMSPEETPYLDQRLQVIHDNQDSIFSSKKIDKKYLHLLNTASAVIFDELQNKSSKDRCIMNRFRYAVVDSFREDGSGSRINGLIRLISSTNSHQRMQPALVKFG